MELREGWRALHDRWVDELRKLDRRQLHDKLANLITLSEGKAGA